MLFVHVTEFRENKDVQYDDLSDGRPYAIKVEQIHQEAKPNLEHAQERKGPAPVKCNLRCSLILINILSHVNFFIFKNTSERDRQRHRQKDRQSY